MNLFLKFKFNLNQEKLESIESYNYSKAGQLRDIQNDIDNFDIDNYIEWDKCIKNIKRDLLSQNLIQIIILLEYEIIKKLRFQKIEKLNKKI